METPQTPKTKQPVSIKEKKWVLKKPMPQSFSDSFPEIPSIIKQLLCDRSITTQEKIDEFLNPDYTKDVHDPFLFKDMEKAVQKIIDAALNNDLIVIHGDYDADGVSASVILTNALRELGANFEVFLPHRETDGYGLNERTVRLLHERKAKIIITCDCGISNAQEIDSANALGISTIITDHHAHPEKLPQAFAIIHPKIPGETYPDKTLAGGGVAFKLAQALLQKYEQKHGKLPGGKAHDAFSKWLVDMVAISSIADMVPLLGETRTLVKYGLVVMNKLRRPGLKKIIQLSGIINHKTDLKKLKITPQDIAFKIAPRINAAGRMNHANVAYNLLVCEDPAQADKLGEELQKNNSDRQVLTEQLVKEAREMAEKSGQSSNYAIFVLGKNWSTGIIGLIASKIKDIYNKPSIVMGLNNGEITGSGRSVPGFDLIKALQEIQDSAQYFKKFGGHPQACGFTIKEPGMLENFKKDLLGKAESALKSTDLAPSINIDAEVELEDINWELYDLIDKFEPFGIGNPEPRYLARALKIINIENVGNDGKHVKIHVTHKTGVVRKLIGFFCSELCSGILKGDNVDLVFEVGVNEWNGTRELQLKIVDLRKL